jgi:hypothetical protein
MWGAPSGLELIASTSRPRRRHRELRSKPILQSGQRHVWPVIVAYVPFESTPRSILDPAIGDAHYPSDSDESYSASCTEITLGLMLAIRPSRSV